MKPDKDAWGEDDRRNVDLYTNLVERFGAEVRALNWRSAELQHRRFAVLAQVGELKSASVLDVGCGMGDLLDWFRASDITVNYTGIDLTPKMIEISTLKFPGETFVCGSLLDVQGQLRESYDFVLASGIFYYRQHAPWTFLTQMVTSMFGLCEKAIAFNSLSAWAVPKEPREYYPDPIETLAFCRSLTPWVVLRLDYHPGDFTIYMYKKRCLEP